MSLVKLGCCKNVLKKKDNNSEKVKKGREEKSEYPNQMRTKRGRGKTGKDKVKGLRNQLQAWHSMLDTGKKSEEMLRDEKKKKG